MYFFILLVIYLVAEGSALVFVAGHTGWLAALALIFLVSMAGAYLVRRQGSMALFRIQEAIARNASPDAELLDGVFIFAAGLLLFIPGFLSDLAGLALLVPPLRKTCGPWLLSYLKSRVKSGRYIKTYTVYDYEWRAPGRDNGARGGDGEAGEDVAGNERGQGRLRIIDVPSREISPAGPGDELDAKRPGPGGANDNADADARRPGGNNRSGA